MKLTRYAQLFPPTDDTIPTIDSDAIAALAHKIREDDLRRQPTESGVPAGYTYFGQFVDHDLSFMQQTDQAPDAPLSVEDLRNRRRASLDLDSVYGSGLYDSAVPYNYDTGEFELGLTEDGKPRDLPRGKGFRALIADPRNDENLLVAQMQVLFMNLHNKIMRGIRAKSPKQKVATVFHRARKEVVHLYRHVVLHDFAARLLNYVVYEAVILQKKGRLARPDKRWYDLPIEFSTAAFRLHGMVRTTYALQRGADDKPVDVPLTPLLFTYQQEPEHQKPPYKLRNDLVVDWRLFFDEGAQPAFPISPSISFDIPDVLHAAAARGANAAQVAANTGAQAVAVAAAGLGLAAGVQGVGAAGAAAVAAAASMAKQLGGNTHHTLSPGTGAFHLMARTLKRGKQVQLAAADSAIADIKRQHPRLAKQLRLGEFSCDFFARDEYREQDWIKKPPLWLYCMLEAQERCNGSRLGILGSWIVADTLRMANQPSMYFKRNWKLADSPVYQALGKTHPSLTIGDLVKYTYHQ